MMNNHNQYLSSMNTMMPSMTTQSSQQQQQQPQQENQYDRPSINSQQCLADKIQAVRHLGESENQHSNSSQHQSQFSIKYIEDCMFDLIHNFILMFEQYYMQLTELFEDNLFGIMKDKASFISRLSHSVKLIRK
ncbi:unnamed protein product [Rotaria sp. Silwood2]|nr:unnamed protein product [Rotaria sp. Silwood2]